MHRTTVVALILMLLGSACGGAADETAEPTTESSLAPPNSNLPNGEGPAEGETTTDPSLAPPNSNPPEGETPSEDEEEPVSETPSLDDPVAYAVADLAELIGADTVDIAVVANEPVTWRDGSLGCPQPGMAYTQALVPGRRIILEHSGVEYNYHAGRSGEPFYCATPAEPADSEVPSMDE